MALDIEKIRSEFPILERKLPNGKQLVYFDNAATSQKPKCVISAMSDYYEQYNSNAHRANHTLADEATTALDAVGITAKVSGVLAAANIPCNVIAAYHHDYFLVPLALGEKALELLNSSQSQA